MLLYLIDCEFRCQGHRFTRKYYICEQFTNVGELLMKNVNVNKEAILLLIVVKYNICRVLLTSQESALEDVAMRCKKISFNCCEPVLKKGVDPEQFTNVRYLFIVWLLFFFHEVICS